MKMKKVAIVLVAFVVGTVVGFLITPTVIREFISGLNAVVSTFGPMEGIKLHLNFALCGGVMFAVAAAVARSIPRFIIYLAAGITASVVTAWIEHRQFIEILGSVPSGFPPSAIFLSSLPLIRIPLIGAASILMVAMLFHYLMDAKASGPGEPSDDPKI